MNYRHLTQEQRYQIQCLVRAGCSNRAIAPLIGCHPSTVSRERRRNGVDGGYRAVAAQQRASDRRYIASSVPRIVPKTWREVERALAEDWSPEEIAGRRRQQRRQRVSHERIYQYIAADRIAGGTLWLRLRQRKYRYRRRCVPGRFAHARSIHERPGHIERRRQPGHWECDTMVSSTGIAGLVTSVERKSRFVRLRRVKSRKARPVTCALLAKLMPLVGLVRSLTFDRGSEFAEYTLIEHALGAKTYFADPHCAWQRGTNENTNGLLRQYFPPDRCMSTLTDAEVDRIERKLNNRPRKALGFRTPSEVLLGTQQRGALQS